MNFHNILHDDMRNGDGLRVVLFVSGCEHHCFNCQNPQTWNEGNGIEFDLAAKEEIFDQLSKDYISGITFSGGDPLHHSNLNDIYKLITDIKSEFPTKNIWIYTGYTWESIMSFEAELENAKQEMDTRFGHKTYAQGEEFTYQPSDFSLRKRIIKQCDVLVDGEYIEDLADINYPWAGSTNQRVIDVQKSLAENKIILWNAD